MKKTNLHCQNFQKSLSKLKVDAYWVTHIPDLFYLSGIDQEQTREDKCLGWCCHRPKKRPPPAKLFFQ